ncbi:MAG: hypothetical protein WAU77_06695 [Solirubrobacteraceae bacterium]
MREIRLYDSLSRELVPVSAGDAIRVEVRTSPIVVDGGVDVVSTRPLVLFSFLERFLQREGFATKFLFDSPGGGDMLYELSELDPLSEPDSPDSPDSRGEHAGEHDADRDGELDAKRGVDLDGELDVGRGADRDGELDAKRGVDLDGEHDGEHGVDLDGGLDVGRGADRDGGLDAERDGEDDYDSGPDVGMSLLEVPRSDVDRWVNICFGASRDGVEAEPASAGERILLSDALKHFGHPAVALYLLGTHYSLPLGDALTGLATGSKNASRIREALEKLVPDQPSPPDMRHYMEAFRDALANDLDTPTAFVVMFEWLLEAERRGGEVGDNDLRVMLEVLELEDLAAPTGVS